jgi:hypothetical protein
MTTRKGLWLLGGATVVLLVPGRAAAAEVCGTIAEFNAAMVATGGSVEEVSVEYDLVGVNPADFPGTKGSLGQLRFTGCDLGGQDAAIKVYGPEDPPNEAHPAGTLKQEYGNACCGGECGEGWADPNASEVIFVDGTEQCHVRFWMDPLTFGYSFQCDGVTYDGLGANDYANRVDHIAILEYHTAEGGITWELPNATATNDVACWVEVPTGMETITVPVAQDVTAAPSQPDAVFADIGDLAVEAGDNEAYLQFQVPAIEGEITEAILYMHTRPESSAEGDGGEVHVVTSHDWSEATLTFNTRPPMAAASLGRIGPAASDVWVSLDVTAAVAQAGTHSFAVVSPPGDGNGTHFMSKEGAPDLAAYLLLKVAACDGETDEGCAGPADGSGSGGGMPGDGSETGAATSGDATAGAATAGEDAGGTAGGGLGTFGLDRGDGGSGCACTASEPVRPWAPVLALAFVPAVLRRRRGRAGPDRGA